MIILAILVAVAAGSYFLFRKSATLPETVAAKRGEVVQEVSVTGNTAPAETVSLAFEQIGKVSRVYVDVGDKVSAGQTLIELDSSDLYAQLAEAEANIEAAQAKLDELNKGTRPEEITVYEIKLANAETALGDAQKSMVAQIQDDYTKSDDAIRAEVDQFLNNPRSLNPSLAFQISNPYLKSDLENGRVVMETLLTSWEASLKNLTSSGDLDSYIGAAKNNLNQVKAFLEKAALAVSYAIPGPSLTQATIDTFTTAASTARANVNIAIANLQTAEGKLSSAESNVSLAQKELDLEKAGSMPEQIAGQAAAVKQARASADVIRVKIGKNILKSPINGIITEQDAKVGQIVSANNTVVSVISSGGFEIQANIPEADIAKVKIGDSAKVTLDAFGSGVIFDAKVTKIDPGETIIEGVATYKTTFQFVTENTGVKTGMTANIDILTAQKENVIVIPQRVVVVKDGKKIVKILADDGTIKEIKVETGLRGSDGNIEIISGINDGDKVVTSIIEE